MNFLIALLGFAAGCALVGAGLLYVFAPAAMQHFLKTVGVSAALIFFAAFTVWDLACAAGPDRLILALAVISPIAYLIRARRQRDPAAPRRFRGAERIPVLPHAGAARPVVEGEHGDIGGTEGENEGA